ncbi:MAG: DEAD/DEAH box helicase [Hymenobacter sp.]|nr:MAG: DEAD/DEAH box helicase [Hymenobacter sp.]
MGRGKTTGTAKAATATKKAAKQPAAAPVGLSSALVLNHYILRLFGVEELEALSKELKDSHLEGYDADNVSHYFHELKRWLPLGGELTEDRLKQYDANIYRHTHAISQQRPVKWKYFQYLALLFTEIYLDEYFSNPAGLLDELNKHRQTAPTRRRNFTGLTPYTREGLNKLAYWNATGSGKTLLMHINILQYQHYLTRQRKGKELNRILVLTPNEGLSKQHLREFEESGLKATIFDKNAPPLFQGTGIEIIDLHKLEETSGPGTVAIEAFEGNNLVLVDEAHRGGQDSKKIRPMRNRLTQGGFSFEYSATFGQSVNAQQGTNRAKFLDEYGKATLFDYSYRYFYDDGYGKDYQILNLDEKWNRANVEMYLTALLLSFYEQLLVFEENGSIIDPYLVARPLAVFVGGKVAAALP